MKKNFKKWLCVLLAVALLVPTLPLIAGAIAPTTGGSVQGATSSGQAPLKVEIKSDKNKYTLLGKMEFTATITNTSNSTVNNISAEALFGKDVFKGNILPLKRGSQIKATKASLAPGESFQLRYYTAVGTLKSLDSLLLPIYFFVHFLSHGSWLDVRDNGFNDGRAFVEASKSVGLATLFSGQYNASTTVRVWYGGEHDNSNIEVYPELEENHVRYDSSTGINYIDNSVIVFFKHGTSQTQITEIVTSINGTITWKISQMEYTVKIPVNSLQGINQTCEKLMRHEQVVYATCDSVSEIAPDKIPNDPWEGTSLNPEIWDESNPAGANWGLEAIEAPSAWEYENRFQHISIGIVDTGFDTGHEDLKNKIQLVPDWMIDVNYKDAHGTHVAGIVGAEANNKKGITGIVWNSTIYGVDWEPTAKQKWNQDARILAGLRYCVQAGAKVVNFSIGQSNRIPNGSTSHPVEAMNHIGQLSAVFIQQLLLEGYDFVVVQSSGNGTSGKNNPSDSKEQANPNNILAIDSFNNGIFASVRSNNIVIIDNSITKQDILSRIIIVGNAQRNPDGNYQQHVASNGGMGVDICAPGTEIYSTVPGGLSGKYEKEDWIGTSMAAPMVAGVCALVWSTNLSFKGWQVKDIVCSEGNTRYKVYDNPDGKHTTNNEYRLVNAKMAVEAALYNDKGELSGVVRDKDTNSPLADVDVYAVSTDGTVTAKTYTYANGTFEFLLPEGQYNLVFSKNGYVSTTSGVTVTRDVYHVMLEPVLMQKQGGGEQPTQGTINGKVLEQGTSVPLSGVLVQATKTGTTAVVASATTNASGLYSLTVDRGASYSLKFTKSGYAEQTRATLGIYNDTAMLDVVMVPSLFAGGNGTESAPYQISTPKQLDNVRNYLSSNFTLLNDIDLSGWSNWEPIGGSSSSSYIVNSFSGTFDGNGYVVKNMVVNIDASGSHDVGLFSRLENATVKNTGIVGSVINAVITFPWVADAGGIAGRAANSIIDNCYNASAISVSSYNAYGGGIVGSCSSSDLINCYNTGKVSVNGKSAGGIVGGGSVVNIANCRNMGEVYATGETAGGIIGTNPNIVSNCYNAGTVSASTNAGGIVGSSPTTMINDCYNVGTISSSSSRAYVGGIVGANLFATINACYSTGVVSVTDTNAYAGGIAGANHSSVSYCYNLNNISASVGLNYGTFANVHTLTETQMKQQSSFTGFDFDTKWAINPSINNGYPYLRGMQL